MENHEVITDIPTYSMAIPSEITPGNGSTSTEEHKICPLCQSQVKLYFINFNEKFLMCENEECEYPFGMTELEFVKEVDEVASDKEVASIKSKFSCISPSAACSITSTNAWNDIDKLNKACESEASQLETSSLGSGMSFTHRFRNIQKNEKLQKVDQAEIKKNLEEIKGLNSELKEVIEDVNMKNEKWIKNLKSFQEMSGFPLLKPEEISILKADEPIIGGGELKIDIDTDGANNMSSIKIQIISNTGLVNDAKELDNVKDTESGKQELIVNSENFGDTDNNASELKDIGTSSENK